jgi:hypothetical protein
VFRLRLKRSDQVGSVGVASFEQVFARRRAESDAFYGADLSPELSDRERLVSRRAYAGLLWSKQFYHYVVEDWLLGDPATPAPPAARRKGRNREWRHLHARDILSMPDKWEYPWFASWDSAFHMIPFARIDGEFAKSQLQLFLREWYMHPNGQVPAYEFAFILNTDLRRRRRRNKVPMTFVTTVFTAPAASGVLRIRSEERARSSGRSPIVSLSALCADGVQSRVARRSVRAPV